MSNEILPTDIVRSSPDKIHEPESDLGSLAGEAVESCFTSVQQHVRETALEFDRLNAAIQADARDLVQELAETSQRWSQLIKESTAMGEGVRDSIRTQQELIRKFMRKATNGDGRETNGSGA